MKYLHIRTYKGQKLLYWYPKDRYFVQGQWKKCPFKGGEVKSLDEAEALNHQLEEWRKGKVKTPGRHYEDGSAGWLVGQYKEDERFEQLAPATKKLYQYSFNEMLDVLGDIPVDKVSRKQVSMFYKTFKDTVRKKSQIMQNCRVLFQYAVDEDMIENNPFAKQRVGKAAPRDTTWTPELLEAAKAKAIEKNMPSIAVALQMGYDLGQRPQDLRAVGWSRYDGKKIRLKQLKTRNAWIEVTLLPELKQMLDTAPRNSPIILIEETTGKPYSKDMLCRRVREVMTDAGIGSELQFRDLRRTAVVRLMEAGCTVPEICSVTGHKLKEAENILEVYGPRTSNQAENAILKLQKSKVSASNSQNKVESVIV